MKWKDRPWILYAIIILAFSGAGLLWRIHEGFSIDITIELLGAIFTIVIIDELLVKDKRKRWAVVKNEIEYILARNINVIRDDVLRTMFSFKPDIKNKGDLDSIEDNIREQKNREFQRVLAMKDGEIMGVLKEGYLKRKYDGYYEEEAEGLWRILNTRYSEHLEPEVVDELLKLHLHMRDLHNNIKLYNRGKEENRDYYIKKGTREIVYSTRSMVKSLIKLKSMGYSMSTYR